MTSATPIVAQTAASSERWVTAAVLCALAARELKAGAVFHGRDLASWVRRRLDDAQRNHATTRLIALGFLTHRLCLVDGEREMAYTVTADGAAAIAEAARGHVRRSGPKTTRTVAPAGPQTFAGRLWALLRIRRILSAPEAAELLVDAGGPVATRAKTARRYLARWATTGAVGRSPKRTNCVGTSNGEVRFVLLIDSPAPPQWCRVARESRAA